MSTNKGKRKLSKQLKRAIITTVAFAVAISIMGMLNQLKSSLNSACKVQQQKMDLILDEAQWADTGFSSEELYKFLMEEFQDNEFIINDNSKILVYDCSSKTIYGTPQEGTSLKSLVFALDFTDFSYLPLNNSFYYISDYNSGSEIIIETPMSQINWITSSAISSNGFVIAISIGCILIFLLIAFLLRLEEKKMLRVIKVIGTVWICVITVLFLSFNVLAEIYQDNIGYYSMLNEVDNDVNTISAMSEDEATALYQELCADDPETAKLAEEKNFTGVRDKLLFMETNSMIQMALEQDSALSNVSFNDNIWDTSVQISDRVQIMQDDQYVINTFWGDILQSIMFIALYIIIISIVRPTQEDKNGVVENASTKQLSRITFLKNVADALMSVVAMAILSNIVKTNFSEGAAKQVVNWTLTGTGFVSLLAVIMIPFVLKKLGSTKKFLILSLILCVIGSAACMMTNRIWIFLAGYLIIAFTETVILQLRIMLPLQEEEQINKGYDQGQFISDSGRVGSLYGMVSGGVVGSFLPARFIFFIITALTVVCLILAIRMPKIQYKGFQFKTGYIRKAVFQKSVIPVFLLIMIPYGFISYCFKKIIPLNIAELGLTTTLVSFILFFRDSCVFFFKKNKKTKRVWRIKSTQVNVIMGMIASAAVLVGCYFVKNIYVTLALTLVMAFLQAGMSSQSRNLVFETTGSDNRKFFGNSFISSASRQVSKTIAPTIASINMCLLAAAMAVGSGGYFLYLKLGKKHKEDTFLDE